LGPVALAREVITYLTLPTEYLRNTISSPPWLDVVALLAGAAIVVGLVMLVIRWPTVVHTGPAVMVITVALVSVAAWLIQVLFGWQVAFRTAYGALPLAALAFGAASLVAPGRLSRIVTAGVLVALVLAMTAWTAIVVLQTPHSALLNP
jgi:D-alanyl-D-alanine carboxypeptidase (penicillin-binding protein 5/6)